MSKRVKTYAKSDQKIFRRTAMTSKAVNITKRQPRGGRRF